MKRALLVGINYPGTAHALRGCVNDVVEMNQIITQHYGFTDGKNKRMLTDHSATTQNILERLEWLVDGATAGDVLFFHYSGHGSQTVDIDYDKHDEPDGLDEIICPIDLNWRDKIVKDDDFARIFGKVADGVNLTVVLDCCHSGTGLRGGLANPMLADMSGPNRDRSLPMPIDIANRAFGRNLEPKARGLYTDRARQKEDDQKGLLISGCRSNQTSADAWIQQRGKFMGALSFNLSKALAESNYDISYAQLHTKALSYIASAGYTQRPELSGPVASRAKKFLEPF